jgi:hypothetical protein
VPGGEPGAPVVVSGVRSGPALLLVYLRAELTVTICGG